MLLLENEDSKITNYFGNLALDYKNYIFGLTIIIIFLSIFGISKLEVENSFINYFNKKTEIYQGMKLIDEKLGGTTPLEVILKFPDEKMRKKMMKMTGVMKKKMMRNIGLQKIK